MKRNWLIHQRKLMGLTQSEVAERAGISRSYYNQIEMGGRNPSGSVALKLSTFFDIDMSYFFICNVAKVNNQEAEKVANKYEGMEIS